MLGLIHKINAYEQKIIYENQDYIIDNNIKKPKDDTFKNRNEIKIISVTFYCIIVNIFVKLAKF